MAKLDERLFPLLQTLVGANVDWLVFELINGIGAGIVVEETAEDLASARLLARQDREPRRPAERKAISVQCRELEGDEQIVWAARYVAERLQSALLMMDASIERLDSLIIDAHVETRADKQSGVTLRLLDDGEELTVSLEGRSAAREGVEDLLNALDRWVRDITEDRTAL